ncbi:MAG: molybdopterin molybdenumtransferase MoeA, partial [Verrucomicrobia bacterium]|nr:molybdopterin molybdenumtransferase MoeA [Verrucomicrobiota bacterium]
MLVPVEDAREIILAHMPVMGIEEVWLNDALGRVLAQEVVAPLPLPHWDNSSVDGYAVRAEDVSGASPENPSELRLMGQWPAGQPGDQVVEPGACLRVFTGSPLPQGADAVVMQEDTRLVDASAEARVWVCDKVRPFEHVRLA